MFGSMHTAALLGKRRRFVHIAPAESERNAGGLKGRLVEPRKPGFSGA